MDPRHRQILEAVDELHAEGRVTVMAADVAVKLGLRDPAAMGVFFDEVRAIGWVRVVARGFTGDNEFELTPDGRRELEAALERPAPFATIEELEPKLREFLDYWQYDQPFQAPVLHQWLCLQDLAEADLRLLIAQMHARGMIRPHGDGWYPV